MGGKPRSRAGELDLPAQQAREGSREDLLTLLLQAVPAIVMHVDDDFITRFSNYVEPGCSERALGRSAFEFVGPEETLRARGVFEEVLKTGKDGQFVVEVPAPGGP